VEIPESRIVWKSGKRRVKELTKKPITFTIGVYLE